MDGGFIVAVCEINGIVDQFDFDIGIFSAKRRQCFINAFCNRDLAGALGAEDGKGDYGVAIEARE